MIPVAIQPWMLKGGAILGLLALIFYGGCRTQKSIDSAKITKAKARYERAESIINTQSANIGILRGSLERQNEAWIRMSNESKEREASIKASHEKALEQLRSRSDRAVRDAQQEASELRKRIAKLSVAESCIETLKEISK